MSGPVTSAPKYSDYGSNGALAKVLIALPDTNWGMEPRSLATKISELDRGKVRWWADRQDKAECLARLLDIPLEDLGIHGQTGKEVFHFSEFPECPPLDLKREGSWQLAEEQLDPKQVTPGLSGRETLTHWLSNAVLGSWRPPHEMDWLHISDDLHRQLLSRQLSAMGRYEVVSVETLADAERRLANPKPVIVSVSRDGGEGDLAALACRPQDAGLLVIAPFMISARKETSSADWLGWEAKAARGAERRIFDLTGTHSVSGAMQRWTLTKLPDWRKRLLEWVEEKLNRQGSDTRFSAQGIGDWLEHFDPLAVWFSTTADVMQLCRLGHLTSERKLPEPGAPEAGERLAQLMFAREKPAVIWRIRQLVNSRWHHNNHSWTGALSLEAWLDISSAGAVSVSRSDIEQIAAGKTKKDRNKEADRVGNLLETGNPDALLATGLLKEVQRGLFDFQHQGLARLLVRDSLTRQITQESPETWALNCFDPDRRPIVDAALNAISIESLVTVGGRLADEPKDLASAIGASEALFMAIARRIGNVELEQVPAPLLGLAKTVVQRLDMSDDSSLALPWSRPLESQAERLEWIAACWAWSLLPTCGIEMQDSWLFPGWSKSLPNPPYWLSMVSPDEQCKLASPALRQFLRIADQWVKELDEPVENVPTMLLLSYMRRAAYGGFAMQSAWWRELMKMPWATELIQNFVESAEKQAVRAMWKSFVTAEREAVAEGGWTNIYIHYLPIRFSLLRHLEPEAILEGLSEADLSYLGMQPELLPPKARATLLNILSKNPPVKSFFDALPFIERFGSQALPALEACLSSDVLGYANAAAQCMWRWDAEKAESLLRHPESVSDEGVSSLLWACPEKHLSMALEVLANNPEMLPLEERERWTRKYLPNAGRYAVELLKLMHWGEGSSSRDSRV